MRGLGRFETNQIAFATFFEFSSAGSKKIKRVSWYLLSVAEYVLISCLILLKEVSVIPR